MWADPLPPTSRSREYRLDLFFIPRHMCDHDEQSRTTTELDEEQRRRVLELAASGVSQREIANSVFGEARYRGGVERILKSNENASFASQDASKSEATRAADDTLPMSD